MFQESITGGDKQHLIKRVSEQYKYLPYRQTKIALDASIFIRHQVKSVAGLF